MEGARSISIDCGPVIRTGSSVRANDLPPIWRLWTHRRSPIGEMDWCNLAYRLEPERSD